jgi:hypothetical protein
MTTEFRSVLELVHDRLGDVLRWSNRATAALVSLGSIFFLLAAFTIQIAREPDKMLHTQAFFYNYREFSEANRLAVIAKEETSTPPISGGEPDEDALKDPDWDGAVAGAAVGYSLGQSIPLVGFALGPVIGGFLGYKMDQRI